MVDSNNPYAMRRWSMSKWSWVSEKHHSDRHQPGQPTGGAEVDAERQWGRFGLKLEVLKKNSVKGIKPLKGEW